ncbi:DAK2 domain-containing protein [Dendrosporobacter sp. 1207_IL3150]|uniref:DAK2 domain-containing protein n=1 Tax=Dendrosporobacter sp. 1207_IL3150 TaxID=3084054 RepID=UPI002FDB27A8
MTSSKELITGGDFRRMIAGAYSAFLLEHEKINKLNVFPVPDGDTGTNMLLTLGAVARAIAEAPERGIGSLSKRAADSAIMGARGNSGVILAQIFRGIARGLQGKEQADSSEIGKAFQYGVLYAYRAVSKPVEGTILTVSKGIAKGARRAVRAGLPFDEILDEAIRAGESEVERTPELLPTLKAAGVVDAGGKGLIVFLKGCMEGLGGAYAGPESDIDKTLRAIVPTAEFEAARPYCTEFIIKNYKVKIDEVKSQLAKLGESLIVAEGSDLIKVHIHTDRPGHVLESAITWGTLHNIKIDNMADQHINAVESQSREKSCIAVISVSPGPGIAEIMKQMGAAIIISGGQSMNPSVEEFVAAIHSGIADRYIILPNNSNIVLAAAQVKKLVGDAAEVVPTTNVPQGLAALLAFSSEEDLANNLERMKSRIGEVTAAGITVAVRDCTIGACQVAEGSFIGVVNNEVTVYDTSVQGTLVKLVQNLLKSANAIVSLYYGSDLTLDEARAITENLKEVVPGIEIELYYGGQPHYQFIVSIE